MSRVAGKPFVFVLLGPTASGKSQLAMQLAAKHALEIVSIDSAQVYRGMDIGTAKPSAAERARRAASPHRPDRPDGGLFRGPLPGRCLARSSGNSGKKKNSAARRRHDALLPGPVAGHRRPAAGRTRAARADRRARRAPRLAGAARRPGARGSGHRRAPRPQRRAAHPARARSLGAHRQADVRAAAVRRCAIAVRAARPSPSSLQSVRRFISALRSASTRC